jgi:hypothetical protein
MTSLEAEREARRHRHYSTVIPIENFAVKCRS